MRHFLLQLALRVRDLFPLLGGLRPVWFCGLCLLTVCSITHAAEADNYPQKPIHLIVPFPPGGAVDILGRLLGQHLSEQFNQSVVIDNRPGANGNLAMEALVKLPADGYSLLIAGNGLATNGILYPKSTYNMPRDFSAIGYVGQAPLIMVVSKNSPYQSVQEIVAAARKAPGVLTYASAGNGSSAHLGAELLKYTAKIDLTHIAYKGGAPAMIDLVGDRVTLMLLDPAQVMPQLKAERLRAIAVGTTKRVALLPEVQTMEEAGYPKLETTVWWGVVGPANIPEFIVNKLNAGLNRALADPLTAAKLSELGVTSKPGTSTEFKSFLLDEMSKWSTVVKSAEIRGD